MGRKITSVKQGDIIKLSSRDKYSRSLYNKSEDIKDDYVIDKVYDAYIRCTNLKTGQQKAFTLGDLVMNGIESAFPNS